MKDSINIHTVALLYGANEGALEKNLQFAFQKIGELGKIIKTSNIFESEAWGFESQNFLNQALILNTYLTPTDLLGALQQIEKKAGRKTKTSTNYESRVLDIDIIFYDNVIMKSLKLTIPHPHMQNRKFVLEPLNEIIPEYKHPILKKSIQELLKACTDNGKVWEYKK